MRSEKKYLISVICTIILCLSFIFTDHIRIGKTTLWIARVILFLVTIRTTDKDIIWMILLFGFGTPTWFIISGNTLEKTIAVSMMVFILSNIIWALVLLRAKRIENELRNSKCSLEESEKSLSDSLDKLGLLFSSAKRRIDRMHKKEELTKQVISSITEELKSAVIINPWKKERILQALAKINR